eukprot:Sspe_Gene.36965::Locus_17860_Transcript_1_1_Confidence_1.000_Length_1098::g.36965::m.36965
MRKLLRTTKSAQIAEAVLQGHPARGRTEVLRVVLERWGEAGFKSPDAVLQYVEHAMDSNLDLALEAVEKLQLLKVRSTGLRVMDMLVRKWEALEMEGRKKATGGIWGYARQF